MVIRQQSTCNRHQAKQWERQDKHSILESVAYIDCQLLFHLLCVELMPGFAIPHAGKLFPRCCCTMWLLNEWCAGNSDDNDANVCDLAMVWCTRLSNDWCCKTGATCCIADGLFPSIRNTECSTNFFVDRYSDGRPAPAKEMNSCTAYISCTTHINVTTTSHKSAHVAC